MFPGSFYMMLPGGSVEPIASLKTPQNPREHTQKMNALFPCLYFTFEMLQKR